MEKREYYYHAIRNTQSKTIEILDSILKNGICPISITHIENDKLGRMNFDDEICICKRSDNNCTNFIKNEFRYQRSF